MTRTKDSELDYGSRVMLALVERNAHRYSAVAVQKAIESSKRAGKRISKREATLIHAVLRGRE